MNRLAIIPMLLLALGGEHERGLQLYRDGKFAEAAAAFRAAIAQDGDSAELQWNLARASFAAGDLEAAEVAAEKYAALAKDTRADLHLGRQRVDEEDPLVGAHLHEAQAGAKVVHRVGLDVHRELLHRRHASLHLVEL
jgi:thioredoxin-like negative regulator of GroEL